MEADKDEADDNQKKDRRLKLTAPKIALFPKKYRLTQQTKLYDPKAKDGLREYLRRLPKPAGS
jgi:hypothetical protein